MELTGHFENGVVVIDGGTPLPPDGTTVTVSVPQLDFKPVKGPRVEVPLVRTGSPGSVILTNEMIAEILQQDDIDRIRGTMNVPS